MALEKKSFKVVPMINLWELKYHLDMANLNPSDMVGEIYVGDY